MIKTEFFKDFMNYYEKASLLQRKNLNIYTGASIDDPLMESVSIYDTVNRHEAGFNKALADIHGTRKRKDLVKYKDFSNKLSSKEFHFVHLVHRFTGSGASFQPTFLQDGTRNPSEHGYKNNHVEKLCELGNVDAMAEYLAVCKEPMVTSVGNQPPSIKNPHPETYRLAQQYYYHLYARNFITDYMTFLMNEEYNFGKPSGIKKAVDFSCQWHKKDGFKQWKFVLTAFVMDTAEYYPELVDPESHCYYGANCIKSMDLMFTKEKGDPKKNDYYEACMTEICKAIQGRPYDVEDICCDFIRYLVEYIPKGYDHLTTEQRKNNSTLKVNGVYPSEIQDRITKIIGG